MLHAKVVYTSNRVFLNQLITFEVNKSKCHSVFFFKSEKKKKKETCKLVQCEEGVNSKNTITPPSSGGVQKLDSRFESELSHFCVE